MRKKAALLSYLLCLILLGFYFENADSFTALKNRLQSRSVPSAMLQYGSMGQLLRKMDLVGVIPNDYSQYFYAKTSQFDAQRRIFRRKGRIGIQLASVEGIGVDPENMPSSLVMGPEQLQGELPVLSISIDENDLHDPTIGLLAGENVFKRGRNWERPAFLSYYENGKLLFASGFGLRIHGGSSRIRGLKIQGGTIREKPLQSFRLYFREIYGADQFKPGILFDKKSEPIKRLVVRKGWIDDLLHISPYFRNSLADALAYDISREIGCIAPHTKPARVFLNGKPQDLFYITEYLDKNYLRSHFGHDNFIFKRIKGKGERPRELNKIVDDRFEKLDGQWTMEEAGKYFDIENLSRWFISILFCATKDSFQGLVVLDRTNPSSKIFFINWDMEESFRNWRHSKELNKIWENDTFEVEVIQSLSIISFGTFR